jgi:UDPglucose 6-dehydrogenase
MAVFGEADAVVIATDWAEFATLDLAAGGRRMHRPILFDGRGLVRPADATAAGLAYRGIGRRSLDPVGAPVIGEA